MLGSEGLSGCTCWMNALRSPRLNSAVQIVAVLTVFSLSRVAASSSFIGLLSRKAWSNGGGANPSIDVGLGHRGAEVGGQVIEVAAVVRLADVPAEHPA